MIDRKTWRAALLGSGGAFALLAGPALAAQPDELNGQIDRLQARLDQLEKQQSATDAKVAAAPADAVVGGDFPGSFKLPGSDTSVAIHGYTKLDFIYDIDQQLGDSVAFTSITPNGTPAQRRDGEFRIHARQSRLTFETRTPTAYGQLQTYIQTDFFGASVGSSQNVSNSDRLRLRHAYGVLGPFLAGQTWTNFASTEEYPETLDFDGPVGQVFARQGQVRYTQTFGRFQASVSAENPQGDFTTSTGTSPSAAEPRVLTDPANNIDRMPDFTGRLSYTDSWGHLAASALLRRLESDNGGGGETGLAKQSSSTIGGGGLVAGTLNVASVADALGGPIGSYLAKDQLGFQGFYGSGIGRYVQVGGGLEQAAVAKNFGTTAVRLETQSQVGGFVWYLHNWTDQLRSNLVYGIQHNHISAAIPQSTALTDRLQSIHANVIWSPVKSVNIGVEFIYGERDGRRNPVTGLEQTGDAKRMQFSAQYVF
jgi:outer membrane murein-binding lipoprotein Lpp